MPGGGASSVRIERMPVSRITPADYNPRLDLRPGDPEFEKLRRSITEFGLVEPLVFNERTGRLVGGHQRLKVLQTLGETEVDVIVVDLDEDRERALNLALNKVQGDWDQDKLGALLAELDEHGFDLSITGFDELEIEELLTPAPPSVDSVRDDGFDAEAEAAQIVEPVAKRGDIWQLGRHRLMCGDATVREDVQRLMDGKLADMIVTDPPYNVDYTGGSGAAMKIQNDNMEDAAFRQFLRAAFENMLGTVKPGGPIYVCHADSEGLNFRSALLEAGWLVKQCLVWVKNALVVGRQDYQWQHEPILYGWKPGAAHCWYGDRDKPTVIDGEAPLGKLSRAELMALVKELRRQVNSTVIREDRPSVNDVHPTMKPIPLVAKLMGNSSQVGEIVQDLFGGSGSTLMAAEQLGRIAHLMEIDPVYVDVIVKRWEQFTGQKGNCERLEASPRR